LVVASWLPISVGNHYLRNFGNAEESVQHKITKRMVDHLPGDVIWDRDIKGFGVRKRASGAKYYVLKMRIGGRQRWITIGRHGSPWTPDTARREAQQLLGLRAAGRDPATERDRHKGAVTQTVTANAQASMLTVRRQVRPHSAQMVTNAVLLKTMSGRLPCKIHPGQRPSKSVAGFPEARIHLAKIP
jgi:hypothetical protein